jgi:hypothetical protein
VLRTSSARYAAFGSVRFAMSSFVRHIVIASLVGTCVLGCSAAGWLGGTLGGIVGATSDAHCDRRYIADGGSNGPFCQEIVDTVAGSQFQDDCRSKFQAQTGDGRCPRTSVIAGCKNRKANDDKSEVWDWYYDVSGLEIEAGVVPGTLFPNAPRNVSDVNGRCIDPKRYEDGADLAMP